MGSPNHDKGCVWNQSLFTILHTIFNTWHFISASGVCKSMHFIVPSEITTMEQKTAVLSCDSVAVNDNAKWWSVRVWNFNLLLIVEENKCLSQWLQTQTMCAWSCGEWCDAALPHHLWRSAIGWFSTWSKLLRVLLFAKFFLGDSQVEGWIWLKFH